MRIFIPKHIEGGLFNMNVQLGPFTISMIQLIIIAAGSAFALSIWQALVKHGVEKFVAGIVVSPIVIITIVVAFFKISELSLIPFIAKIIRTYFLDVPKKFYINYTEVDPLQVIIYRLKTEEENKKIEEKTLKVEKDKLEKLKLFN